MEYKTGSSRIDLSAIAGSKGWKDEVDVKALVAYVSEEKQRIGRDFELQAELNTEWYCGNQELFYSGQQFSLLRQRNPYHRTRLIVDLMSGLVDGFVAKIGLGAIQLLARPATGDFEDYDVAIVQTAVLQYYQRLLQLDEMIVNADLDATLTGEAFVKVVWDAEAGSEFDIQPDDVGLDPESFGRHYGREILRMRTGDVRVSLIPAFNIWWGPPGTSFDDADYVLEEYVRSRAYCMERYDLKPEDMSAAYDSKSWVFRRDTTTGRGLVGYEPDEEMVRVRTLWVKPHLRIRGLERGRHVVLVGEKLVHNEPIPYRHQKIPILRLPLATAPEKTRGITFVTKMIPPQSDINRTVSQFAENRELMANPVWMSREGTIVDLMEWNSRPGGIRFYSGERPTVEQGASMPNNVIVHLQNTIRYMQDICGLHDVSLGKNVPGGRSGTMVGLLREGDDERMSRFFKRRRRFWAKVGRLLLQTLSQYATEDRLIRIGGEEHATESLTFSGPSLTGPKANFGLDYFDIIVKAYGTPQSESARLEKMGQAVQSGFLRPDRPEDRAFYFDALDLGVSRHDIDPRRDARTVQHCRNRRMMQAQYRSPQRGENMDVMMAELDRFRNQTFFRDLPDDTQKMFQQYEDECLALMVRNSLYPQMVAERVMNKMQQAGQLPQLPAPGAQPSQPAEPSVSG